MSTLYGQPNLVYTPDADPGPGVPVDLSCDVRPGVIFDAPIETVDDPVLCDPTRSRTRAGAATVGFTLVVGEDWNTRIEPLFGTTGHIAARVPDATGAGFEADVSWPTSHGAEFDEDGFVEVETLLGASNIAFVPGTVVVAAATSSAKTVDK
jgi:hypothetical protein